MKRLVFDIEANNLLPKVNRIHCLAVMDADTQEEWVFNDEHWRTPLRAALSYWILLM